MWVVVRLGIVLEFTRGKNEQDNKHHPRNNSRRVSSSQRVGELRRLQGGRRRKDHLTMLAVNPWREASRRDELSRIGSWEEERQTYREQRWSEPRRIQFSYAK